MILLKSLYLLLIVFLFGDDSTYLLVQLRDTDICNGQVVVHSLQIELHVLPLLNDHGHPLLNVPGFTLHI